MFRSAALRTSLARFRGGADEPEFFVALIPEMRVRGHQLQENLLDHVLRVCGRETGQRQLLKHPAVLVDDAANGFIGTKRTHLPQPLSPITRSGRPFFPTGSK